MFYGGTPQEPQPPQQQGMPGGMPPQGMPAGGMPPQGMPPQGMPPQGMMPSPQEMPQDVQAMMSDPRFMEFLRKRGAGGNPHPQY